MERQKLPTLKCEVNEGEPLKILHRRGQTRRLARNRVTITYIFQVMARRDKCVILSPLGRGALCPGEG